jgi:ribonuclease HIII
MPNDESRVEDPHAPFERVLIDDFLRSRGYTRQSLFERAGADAIRLLEAASAYASLRLAAIAARAHFLDEIHRPS